MSGSKYYQKEKKQNHIQWPNHPFLTDRFKRLQFIWHSSDRKIYTHIWSWSVYIRKLSLIHGIIIHYTARATGTFQNKQICLCTVHTDAPRLSLSLSSREGASLVERGDRAVGLRYDLFAKEEIRYAVCTVPPPNRYLSFDFCRVQSPNARRLEHTQRRIWWRHSVLIANHFSRIIIRYPSSWLLFSRIFFRRLTSLVARSGD